MSAVVQATCPGCKQVLRIPSDWLKQPFRCKHCRTIIQARAPEPPVADKLRRAPTTPIPPSHAPRPAPRATPAPLPVASLLPPPAAIPVAAPAGVVAPAAIPVASAPPGAPAPAAIPVAGLPSPPPRPFTGIDEAAPGLSPRRRRFSFLPLLIGLVLLGGSAAATIHFWPEIAPLFENQGTSVVQNDDTKPATPSTEPKKEKDSGTANTKEKSVTPSTKEKTTPPDPNKDKKPDPNKDKKPDPNKDKKPDPNKDKKPDPNKDKKLDPNKDKKPDPNKDKKPDPNKDKVVKKPFDGAFPRRALVIGVNNYLFANPVSAGEAIGGRSLASLASKMSDPRLWRMSPKQICLLTDAGSTPNSPIKATIEQTVTEFLKKSRAQDRVVLMFIGHAREKDDKAYLAPLDADLDAPDSMIPLDWLYKQLADCPAKQKVLIVDVCRFNPTKSGERAPSEPMWPKFDLALKNPPAGVQVWTSCIEGQHSYELGDSSVFLDALHILSGKGVDIASPKPEDDLPLEQMVTIVNAEMKKILEQRKPEQTSRLSGQMKEGGPPFNPEEPMAPEPVVIAPIKKTEAEAARVRSILKELNVPPLKKNQEGLLPYEAMPPFGDALGKLPSADPPEKLLKAIEKARAALWAISQYPAPAELAEAAAKIREEEGLKGNLGSLRDHYPAPAANANAETQFKNAAEAESRRVGGFLRVLEDELKNLAEAEKLKKEAPKYWQANFDFIRARLMTQTAYLYEYSTLVAGLRKEFPPKGEAPLNRGWRVSSTKKMSGDGSGRKLARDAEKIFDGLAKDFAGTPWEILAKREKFTTLGLEWKPN